MPGQKVIHSLEQPVHVTKSCCCCLQENEDREPDPHSPDMSCYHTALPALQDCLLSGLVKGTSSLWMLNQLNQGKVGCTV